MAEPMSNETITPVDLQVAADALREWGLDAIADRMRAVARLVDREANQIAQWKAAGDWRGTVDWEEVAKTVPPGWWLARDGNSAWWAHNRKPEFDGTAWISGGFTWGPCVSPVWPLRYDVQGPDSLVQRPWLSSDVLRVREVPE